MCNADLGRPPKAFRITMSLINELTMFLFLNVRRHWSAITYIFISPRSTWVRKVSLIKIIAFIYFICSTYLWAPAYFCLVVLSSVLIPCTFSVLPNSTSVATLLTTYSHRTSWYTAFFGDNVYELRQSEVTIIINHNHCLTRRRPSRSVDTLCNPAGWNS
jgi:hypothetical protein